MLWNIWVNNISFLYGRFFFQELLHCPGVEEVVGLSLPLSQYFFLCTDFPCSYLVFCRSKQRSSFPDSVCFHTFVKTLAQSKGEFRELCHSSQLVLCAAVPVTCAVTCVTVSAQGGELHSLEEQCPSCSGWQRLSGCSLSGWPRQKALISPELCLVLLSDRTAIVHPPEDSTVIKGTTATLRCQATHDPRISIRFVVSLLLCVLYPSLIL